MALQNQTSAASYNNGSSRKTIVQLTVYNLSKKVSKWIYFQVSTAGTNCHAAVVSRTNG